MGAEYQRTGFILRIDPDGTFADLECIASQDANVMYVMAALQPVLKEAGIIYGLDLDAVDNAFERLPSLTPGERIRIANGKPPTRSVDGHVEYFIDVSGRAQYQADDNATSVDYKKATTISSVKAGTLLAQIHPPVPGDVGVTVMGKTLQPRTPRSALLRCGSNVSCNEAEGTYTAVEEGRPVLEGSVLSILPIYEVGTDVDYNTGHITFGGSVIVHGNVQDGFNITARDIEVQGVVGASEIRVQGNVTINGGVNGKGKALIQAGGTVAAKYLNQVRVESVGDVHIRREVVNSTVWTRGRLMAGTLMGGEVLALKGAEVMVLGSDMGVLTRVEPGIDYEYRKLEEKQEKFNHILDQILAPITPLFGERAKFKALPEEKKTEIAAVFEKFRKIKDAHNILSTQMQARSAGYSADPLKEVVVRKTLYHDSFVRTNLCQRSFDKDHNGPLVLKEDMERGSIRLAAYSERTEYEHGGEG